MTGGVTQFEASAGSVVLGRPGPTSAAWTSCRTAPRRPPASPGPSPHHDTALLHTSTLTRAAAHRPEGACPDAATSLSAPGHRDRGPDLCRQRPFAAHSKAELTAAATLAIDLAAELADVLDWYGGGLTSEVPVLRPVGQLRELASLGSRRHRPGRHGPRRRPPARPAGAAGRRRRAAAACAAGPPDVRPLRPGPPRRARRRLPVPRSRRCRRQRRVGAGDEPGRRRVVPDRAQRRARPASCCGGSTRPCSPTRGSPGSGARPASAATTSNRSPAGRPTRRLGAAAGDADAVVFIRGDLLVHYPTALVYLLPGIVTRVVRARSSRPTTSIRSRPASWPRSAGAPASMASRSTSKLLRAEPSGLDGGYFVVIEEQAGDPRFGLDDAAPEQFTRRPPDLSSWDDLGWGHLVGQPRRRSTASPTPGSRAGASPG